MQKILLFLMVILSSFTSFADWPLGKGRTAFNIAYNIYSTRSYFDNKGAPVYFKQGTFFSSHTLGLAAVHGIAKNLDALVSMPLLYVTSVNTKDSTQLLKTGIGDCQLGLSYHIPTSNLKSYFTIKALYIFPGYSNKTQPYLGYGIQGTQLSAAYSFSPANHSFCSMDYIFTQYFPKDQKNESGPAQHGYNFTLGRYFGNYVYLIFSAGGVFSKSSSKEFNSNLILNKEFDYHKVSASIGKRLTRTTSVYLQGFYTYAGHQAGIGSGGSLSAVIKIP